MGGEKSEPVDPVKVNWFAKTFGGLRSVTNVYKPGMDVQFVKVIEIISLSFVLTVLSSFISNKIFLIMYR